MECSAYVKQISEAVDYLRKQVGDRTFEVGIVLGSGLGDLAERVVDKLVVPYRDIPHFSVSTAPSHAGRLVFGSLADKSVVVMQGRVHLFEGYTAKQITLPIRVMKLLGVKKLLVTNNAGTTRRDAVPGDLLLITDQINLTGESALRGQNLSEFGPRFPPMSTCYSPHMITIAREIAKEQRIVLHEGTYVGMRGPSYETSAEGRMLGILGADAIGMSTVQEVFIYSHLCVCALLMILFNLIFICLLSLIYRYLSLFITFYSCPNKWMRICKMR